MRFFFNRPLNYIPLLKSHIIARAAYKSRTLCARFSLPWKINTKLYYFNIQRDTLKRRRHVVHARQIFRCSNESKLVFEACRKGQTPQLTIARLKKSNNNTYYLLNYSLFFSNFSFRKTSKNIQFFCECFDANKFKATNCSDFLNWLLKLRVF